ncbi:unnamed protein product [Orchesella dallaii]|uniref:C2H2-type domain-containing protein n=1 Tax=Orchesella dallaii TaxID=48710 RepID=A0ABP1PVJ8_9HEXA
MMAKFFDSYTWFFSTDHAEQDRERFLSELVLCKNCVKDSESFGDSILSMKNMLNVVFLKGDKFANTIRSSELDPSLVAGFENQFPEEGGVGAFMQNFRKALLQSYENKLRASISIQTEAGTSSGSSNFERGNVQNEADLDQVSVQNDMEVEGSYMNQEEEDEEISDNGDILDCSESLAAVRVDLLSLPNVQQRQRDDLNQDVNVNEPHSNEVSDDELYLYDEKVDKRNAEVNQSDRDSDFEMDIIENEDAIQAVTAVPDEINFPTSDGKISGGKAHPKKKNFQGKGKAIPPNVANSNDTRFCGIAPRKCPICSCDFKLKIGLSQHLKRKHKRTLAHQCVLCEEKMRTEKDFQRHMELKHEDKLSSMGTFLSGEYLRYSIFDVPLVDDEEMMIPNTTEELPPVVNQTENNPSYFSNEITGNDEDEREPLYVEMMIPNTAEELPPVVNQTENSPSNFSNETTGNGEDEREPLYEENSSQYQNSSEQELQLGESADEKLNGGEEEQLSANSNSPNINGGEAPAVPDIDTVVQELICAVNRLADTIQNELHRNRNGDATSSSHN